MCDFGKFTNIYIYIFTNIFTHLFTHICTHTYVLTHMYAHICIHIYVPTHLVTYLHTLLHSLNKPVTYLHTLLHSLNKPVTCYIFKEKSINIMYFFRFNIKYKLENNCQCTYLIWTYVKLVVTSFSQYLSLPQLFSIRAMHIAGIGALNTSMRQLHRIKNNLHYTVCLKSFSMHTLKRKSIPLRDLN